MQININTPVKPQAPIVEEWMRWEPIEELAPKYTIETICENERTLFIILYEVRDKKKKIRVTFEDAADSYKNTFEFFRMDLINDLCTRYGASFFKEWTFFQVTHSPYMQWLRQQSRGLAGGMGFIHFSFITSNSVLDVLSTKDPHVEVLAPQEERYVRS